MEALFYFSGLAIILVAYGWGYKRGYERRVQEEKELGMSKINKDLA